MDLGKLAKNINDVNEINKALGGRDQGLEKAANVLTGVSELNDSFHGKGSLDKVSNVANELAEVNKLLGGNENSDLGNALTAINDVAEVGKVLKTKEGRTSLAVSLLGSFLKRK